jgi:uncharacterized protein (TIGR00297 family)
MIDTISMAIVLAFLLIFSIITYKKKFLDLEGILIADAIGVAAITFGETNHVMRLVAFVVFFLIGQLASNFPVKKHERRGIKNVLGNSIPALLMLFLIPVFPKYEFIFEMGFFGAVTAALSDTLSSEIGYYSKSKPILITTLKKCKRGTDGGVTLMGEGAALLGGLIMGLIYFFIYANLVTALIIVGAGMVGTTVDSLFGAVFERKKVLNNTQVNLLGSSSGALFALLLGLLFIV